MKALLRMGAISSIFITLPPRYEESCCDVIIDEEMFLMVQPQHPVLI